MRTKVIISTVGSTALLALAACSAVSTSTPAATNSASMPASTPATSVPSTSAPSTPASSAPASPSLTVTQQQAVEAAQSYLSLGTGFSYQGLLQQLTSSAGSGFSKADAEFAINYLKPNWDQQAVIAAKGYLQLGGFSRSSLLQQLTSSFGNGFTEAQAEYALSQVGM